MTGSEKISQLPTYTTPNDVDIVPIVDTTNAITKSITWALIKSTLATYFNGFYATITGTQTLTNKTLTSPILTTPTINIGSDTTGDVYYRKSDGTVARLAAGTSGQVLTSGGVGTAPSYVTPQAVINANATTKGVVQIPTAAQITAGTATGSTGASLAITPDQLALSTPIFNASGLTNVAAPLSKSGTMTKNATDASTTQTIPHGLGKTPKIVALQFAAWSGAGAIVVSAFANAIYDGTTQNSQSAYASGSTNVSVDNTFTLNVSLFSGNTQIGTVTFDATNIYIAWVKSNFPTGSYAGLWFAQ